MERALESPFASSRSRWLVPALALLAFAAGLASDLLNLRFLALGFFGVIAGLVLAAPYAVAVRILFVYLGFEGMAKMVSNYNPVVHVGADLIVMSLVLRWFVSFLLQRASVPPVKPPLLPLFGLHLVWFLVEFANPFSIGLIPSIAAAKVYLTMVTLYGFGFYLSTSKREVHLFMGTWVFTLVVQVFSALYQSYAGPRSVTWLSPLYAKALSKFDAGTTFRPFGTTHLPGVPAIFVYLACCFLLYFVITHRRLLAKLFLAALIPGAVLVLMLCQIRSALLKAIVGPAVFLLLVVMRASERTRKRVLLAMPLLIGSMIFLLPEVTSRWQEEHPESAKGFERSLSLFDYSKVSTARQGGLDHLARFAQEMPLGLGLSRTGAAAGKFENEIRANPFYNFGYATDNFFLAVMVELGIPGSIILTSIIVAILLKGFLGVLRSADPESRTLQAALLCSLFMIVIGLWGAEGLLYNPEAAFFWFFSGSLMRLGSAEPVHL